MRAKVFIDCSGDGDLAAWAGAPFELGDDDGQLLYPTLMFRVNGVVITSYSIHYTKLYDGVRLAVRFGLGFGFALGCAAALGEVSSGPLDAWRRAATASGAGDGTLGVAAAGAAVDPVALRSGVAMRASPFFAWNFRPAVASSSTAKSSYNFV